MKKLRKKKIAIAISLLVFFLIILTVIIATVRIVQYGKVDEKMHCDVAIVLGAATTDEAVSPVYRERINHGIWLFENGYVDYLILTGGVGKGNKKLDALVAKQYAIEKVFLNKPYELKNNPPSPRKILSTQKQLWPQIPWIQQSLSAIRCI